ncbi:hypothetical protein J3E71DRAFT_141216, partial [Bipolaris maydis]
MSAFSFNLLDGVECVSKKKISCSFDEGVFKFGQQEITIGNSMSNMSGGIGGFVGPNHEYFLYCGSGYPEIAFARFNKKARKWRAYKFLQLDTGDQDDDGYFKNIWFAKKELALIFEPKAEYLGIIEHGNFGQNMSCIKFNLRTGEFKGITEEQFKKQKCSTLDADSIWPTLKASN